MCKCSLKSIREFGRYRGHTFTKEHFCRYPQVWGCWLLCSLALDTYTYGEWAMNTWKYSSLYSLDWIRSLFRLNSLDPAELKLATPRTRSKPSTAMLLTERFLKYYYSTETECTMRLKYFFGQSSSLILYYRIKGSSQSMMATQVFPLYCLSLITILQ